MIDGKKLHELVEENFDFMKEVREHIHRYPELSCEEYDTARYIRSFLDDWGIPYEIVAETSTIAMIEGAYPGGTVAIRGDIDALPIEEASSVPFSSENKGVMHACGHDCHATFMLGAAKILSGLREEMHGNVKIIFQRAEEGYIGATEIMGTGLLDDVDSITGLHITEEAELGTFNLNYGIMSSIGAGAELIIKTEGGLATKDSDSQNALMIASRIFTALTTQFSIKFPHNHPVVMVPTKFHTEARPGEVPHTARIFYNFRALDMNDAMIMKELVSTFPDDIAKAYGANLELKIRQPYKPVDNDEWSTDLAVRVIEDAFGIEAVKWVRPYMSGEDFAMYQTKIPGTFIRIGAAVNGVHHPLHTSKTFADERVLKYGVEFLLRYIFAWFESDHNVKREEAGSDIKKRIEVSAGIIRNENKIFACQRGYGSYKGFWEFPGGKVERGESAEEALVREIKEELEIGVKNVEFFESVEHEYPEYDTKVDFFWCEIAEGEITLTEHQDGKWLNAFELDELKWLESDVEILEKIKQNLE